MTDNITLPREVVEETVAVLAQWNLGRGLLLDTLRIHLAAEQPKPSEDVEALRRDAEQGRLLWDWLDNNGLLIRAIRGESLAGYEHPDIKALRRDAELGRWIREETPPIEEIAARVDAMEDER